MRRNRIKLSLRPLPRKNHPRMANRNKRKPLRQSPPKRTNPKPESEHVVVGRLRVVMLTRTGMLTQRSHLQVNVRPRPRPTPRGRKRSLGKYLNPSRKANLSQVRMSPWHQCTLSAPYLYPP